MPEAELITVKEFQDRELLGDYVDLLEKAEIPFSVEDSKPRFDATFANDESRRYYRINVAPVDLQNALELCGRMDEKIMKELPDDYYLFQFSEKKIAEERQEITDELDAPEKENTLIVVCGYIFCVFGGLLGLMLALLILNSKKTTHDGHRVPRYNAATRGHARNMLLIFIVVIILTLFFVGAQLG